MSSYVCRDCGQPHEGLPLTFGPEFPDPYANLSQADRQFRTQISTDQCVIDESYFFIRGRLPIPLIDMREQFVWNVWAVVHKEHFFQMCDSWTQEGREKISGPYLGRLANFISVYPDTRNLILRIEVQPVGERPIFTVEDDHPLKAAQEQGMTRHQLADLVHKIIHS